MAEGLQYKENLTLISGGYPGEGTGSNGLVQNWTDTTGDSGSSTVTYFYHDSATMTDANSTYVEINITDNWTATRDNRNYYHITVSTTINYIRRTKVGNPSPLSVYMFARHDAGGANIWTSGGCVDAANSGTNATNINMGTTTIDLAPGQSTNVHGTVYFRSNICGHNNAKPPSIYVDEFWLGVNFRNTLPPDYRPGKTWNGTDWLSHNREAGSFASTNLFDASAIANTSIVVSNNGQTITMPVVSTGNGLVMSNTTLAGLCPTLAVGDTVYLQMNTTSSVNKYIWLSNSNYLWHPTTARTITATDLGSNVGLYANRIDQGETIQVVISDMRIVRNAGAPFEPYSSKHYFSSGATDIYTSATSKNTMRTQDGGVGTNNPPYTRHNDNTWRNQRKIGIE